MTQPTQRPADDEPMESNDTPPPPAEPAPETENIEEEGDPLGANFA